MRRLLVWSARALGAIALLLLLALVAGWIWFRISLPEVDGEHVVDGLRARVTVIRDEHGIPYIEAESSDDAYFALGFVHAQDRLAQMEFMRRLGAGRLSEIIGEGGLGIDRYMRTLGLYRLAEADFEVLAPDVREALQAYAAGVNAFLASSDGSLPPEFVFLWLEPEPWRPADSLVWGRLMAMRLTGNWSEELLRARLARALPSDRLAELWPASHEGAGLDSPTHNGARVTTPFDAIRPNRDDGSNAWAIAGARSESGFPILANDPHLGLTLPNIWYLARIDTPDLILAGVTTPGVPFHILGRNASLAWGLTTTHGDAADIFIERVTDNHYETPDGPEPFVNREETIRVRFADPVTFRVRSTRHGPVISDVLPAASQLVASGTALSLAHTALLPGDLNAEAIYRVNHSRTIEDLMAALALFRSPQQNVMFADTTGRIGMQVSGRAPIRRSGNGTMPAPGWTGAFDWTGFLPFSEMPRHLDPAAGFIANANNNPTSPSYPHFLAYDWPGKFRAERIEEVLRRDAPASIETSAGLQLDIRSLAAIEIRDLFLDVVRRSRPNQRALVMLRAWDGAMSREAPEPLIYYAWVREAYVAIFADELGDLFEPWLRDRPEALEMALHERTGWCDNVHTNLREACGPMLRRALQRALAELTEVHGPDINSWRWGSVHRARFSGRLFGYVPILGDLLDRSIETDGGNFTVNRGGFDLGDDQRPFAHEHGAGYRAVYDLSDMDRSQMLIALGQSGNPFSRWYDDLLEPWRDGEYVELAPPTDPAHRLVLVPEEQSR